MVRTITFLIFLAIFKTYNGLLVVGPETNIVIEPFEHPIVYRNKLIHAIVPIPERTKPQGRTISNHKICGKTPKGGEISNHKICGKTPKGGEI
jgi:hypothetical protein